MSLEDINVILIATLVMSLLFSSVPTQPIINGAQVIDRSGIEVMVFGTPHLRRHNFEAEPISVDLIRQSLAKYKPDHVVVEWLHPSIKPESTRNYSSYGDLESYAQLWGYEHKGAHEEIYKVTQTVMSLKKQGLPVKDLRLKLGKLYYLIRDKLNAGYQWWLAWEDGADVAEFQQLTRNNFERHELRIYGFHIARQQGLEYITPFDYQGEDAAWLGGKVWVALRDHLLKVKHGVEPGDPGWDELSKQYEKEYDALDHGDMTIVEKYGDIKEAKERLAVSAFWEVTQRRKRQIDNSDGLGYMRYLQSEEFLQSEKEMYYTYWAGVSIGGLGKKNVENYELRNKNMVDFMEADIDRMGSKRVLIIVGSGHKLFLENELKKRGYTIVPSSGFMP